MFGTQIKRLCAYAKAKATSMITGGRTVKGFGMELLTSVAIGLVTVGIILAVGALILAGFVTQTGATPTNASTWTTAYNATIAAQNGIQAMTGFLPTIGIAAGGVAVLGLVLLVLSQFGEHGGR